MNADVVGLVGDRDIVGDLDLRNDEAVLGGELLAHLADPEGEFLMGAEKACRDLLAEQKFDLGRPGADLTESLAQP